MYAHLCSDIGLTPDQILKMTPYQVVHVYQHPRDKHGAIKLPADKVDVREMTLDESLAKFEAQCATFRLPPDQVELGKAKLREIYARNAGGNSRS